MSVSTQNPRIPDLPLSAPQNAEVPDTIYDYLAIIWRYRRLFSLVLLVSILLGFVYSFTRKKVYESATLVVVSAKPDNGGLVASIGDPVAQLQAVTQVPSVETQVGIIKSDAIVAKAFDLLSKDDQIKGFGTPLPGDLPSAPPWSLKVDSSKETEIITVTGAAYDPKVAADFANLVANAYIQADRERAGAATHQAEEYVKLQLSETEKQLAAAATQLADFEKRSGFVSPAEQVNRLVERISLTQSAYNEARASLEESRKMLAVQTRNLAATPKTLNKFENVGPNPAYQSANTDLAQLLSQLATLRSEFAEDSKIVVAQKEKIEAKRKFLAEQPPTISIEKETERNPGMDVLVQRVNEEEARAAGLEGRLRKDNEALNQSFKALKGVPEEKRDALLLQQKLTELQANYAKLSEKDHDLLVAESSVLPSGYVLSEATPALKASSPKHSLNLILFFIIGTTLGVSAVAIANQRDLRFHKLGFIERLGIPILGTIHSLGKDLKKTASELNGSDLVSKLPFECVRTTRNNIFQSQAGKSYKVLCMVGPGGRIGRSGMVTSLAAVLASEGKKTLLVDGDLRDPSLHTWAGLSNDEGLSNWLRGEVDLKRAIKKTPLSHVDLLPSGPNGATAALVLASADLRGALEQLTEDYDFVLIDTADSGRFSDAQNFAVASEATVVVGALDKSLRTEIYQTIRNLKLVDANLVGAVVNLCD